MFRGHVLAVPASVLAATAYNFSCPCSCKNVLQTSFACGTFLMAGARLIRLFQKTKRQPIKGLSLSGSKEARTPDLSREASAHPG